MNSIKIKCPAKINLNLKILRKREDGFHDIESIMQTIGLYDYLTISIEQAEHTHIILNGNSKEIPYNENNLIYKAAKLYTDYTHLSLRVSCYVEKNIPISAGLAGGSTDATGMIFGLNKLCNNVLTNEELHNLCAQLGSDLNVCLSGGRLLCQGRGEKISPVNFASGIVNLIKPKNLGISAKEAYSKFSSKISNTDNNRSKFENDLEWAIIDDYTELLYIKNKYPTSIMTGSGSTFFSLREKFDIKENGYWVQNNIEMIDKGVDIV